LEKSLSGPKRTLANKGVMLKALCVVVCVALNACSALSPTSSTNTSIDEQGLIKLKVIGINDFHGQVLPKGEVGGMQSLGQHILSAIEAGNQPTFVLHAGDHVGASPAESALLQDEPSITFLNHLQAYCELNYTPSCEIIGTAGNHEFDEGSAEMLRLLRGGNHAKGPFLQEKWQGATYKTLSANVIDIESNAPLLPPYVIHNVEGVDIGFIGLTLDSTPELLIPGSVKDLSFENQADIAQYYVKELQNKGIESIFIVIHDGTAEEYYEGKTRPQNQIPETSRFMSFLKSLPDAVDLVITGHSHRFTNAYVSNNNGHTFLVTQAFSSGRAYANIDIEINRETNDVVSTSADVILTSNEISHTLSAPAKNTLSQIDQVVALATNYAEQYTQRVINTYKATSSDMPLGVFIADSHQHALNTDMAVMNSGGLRAQLSPGPITWGQLFAVQPFGNQLFVRRYTGEQLLEIISKRDHWSSDVTISNGQIRWQEKPLDPKSRYTVAGNAYIMNSAPFVEGELVSVDGLDIDATESYIRSLATPFSLSGRLR
jgi:5'-nucleotidase